MLCRFDIHVTPPLPLPQIPGGYLVKHIEGDLRYMLSFDSPESALVWCAAVQECAMYIEWPESALKHWPEEQAGSQLMFRGPRCGGEGRAGAGI